MADSNITKQALARALKELMQEMPFDKINVVQICERCNMSRKSFYYHFKDKYDLVNWIFDVDFYHLMHTEPQDRWAFIERLCRYFDDNREFYRKVISYRGQNSFQDHFRESLYPLLRIRLEQITDGGVEDSFCLDFFAEGIIGSIEWWLMKQNHLPIEIFYKSIRELIYTICKKYETNPEIFLE